MRRAFAERRRLEIPYNNRRCLQVTNDRSWPQPVLVQLQRAALPIALHQVFSRSILHLAHLQRQRSQNVRYARDRRCIHADARLQAEECPPYPPSTLLRLSVYGYLNRVRSSRRLEREAQRNAELM